MARKTYAIEIKTAYELAGKRQVDARWARVATRSTKRQAQQAMREALAERHEGSKGRIVEISP